MHLPPAWLAAGRIPALDGVRALAVLAVTLAHALPAPGSPVPDRVAVWAEPLGRAGVDVFFVLSGFLITHLLLREHERHGRISLWAFWARRLLRILPAYLLLLAALFALTRAGWLAVPAGTWAPALTYTLNLFPDRLAAAGPLGHLWSLCVEEHFYLVWPAALVALGPRRAPWLLAGILLAAPVLRFALHDRGPDVGYWTPTRLDTIAAGCLLAYVVRSRAAARLAARIKGRETAVALGALAFFLASVYVLSRSGKYWLGPKSGLEAAAVALFLFAVTARPDSRAARVLDWKPLAAVGLLSYSLYLAQPFAFAGRFSGWPLGWYGNVPLVVAYAAGSYLLIERPFLRLKDRRAVRSP